MKKILLMCLCWLLAASAFSQASDASAPPAPVPDATQERITIQAERALAEAQYAREEVACYNRFAVNDCIKRARLQRREVLDRLRRRELVLNEVERKREAQQQLERIREKTGAQ